LINAVELTKRREIEIKRLRKGIKLITINECQFDEQFSDLETKTVMEEILKEVETTFIDPRSFYFGGRTNAVVLLEECDPLTHELKYYDFISLYPDVMKSEAYPLGKNFINFNKNLRIMNVLSCTPYKNLYILNEFKY
jgi:DNA polymerase type B, organellar and viral